MVSSLDAVRIDNDLVDALVEQWSQETHTFYLPVSKVTITLQGVVVLLGLWIDSPPVID